MFIYLITLGVYHHQLIIIRKSKDRGYGYMEIESTYVKLKTIWEETIK